MDRLVKEHDGFYRTSKGFCAVVPKLASGTTRDGLNWFSFKLAAYGEEIRIEWPKHSPLAIFDSETAAMVVRSGYGSHPSEDLIAEYNRLIDEPVPPPPFPPEGWVAHPTAPGFFYKGQEVLSEADLRLKAK